MNQRHWVESLYDSFVMRDLIGYAAPGSILIVGLLCELGRIPFLKSLFNSWSGITVLVAASYVAATGLRLLGTSLRLVLFHRRRGFFGRGWLANADMEHPKCCSGKSLLYRYERLFWRGNEKWLGERYGRIYAPRDDPAFNAVVAREGVFMHLTGLAGMAFLTLGVAILFLPHDGFFQILNHPHLGQVSLLQYLNLTPKKDEIIAITFFAISIIFMLGHYRHTHQAEMLRAIRGAMKPPNRSRAGDLRIGVPPIRPGA